MWQLCHLIILYSFNILLTYANDSTDSAASSTKVSTLDNFPSCKEKDENINDCLLRVFAELIPRSKNGIPEINIPPMDPLAINKTTYTFTHPIVNGKVAVRNLKIYGLSDASTQDLDYKRKGDQVIVTVKAKIPHLFVEGQYKAKLRYRTVNISSKGPFNVTFANIDVIVKTISDVIERDNHRYMNVKSINFDPTVGNMKFNAEGLFPEPLLNNAIIEFVNQNWRSIYKTLIAETRAAWEPEILKLSREYFSRVAVDVIIKEE